MIQYKMTFRFLGFIELSLGELNLQAVFLSKFEFTSFIYYISLKNGQKKHMNK